MNFVKYLILIMSVLVILTGCQFTSGNTQDQGSVMEPAVISEQTSGTNTVTTSSASDSASITTKQENTQGREINVPGDFLSIQAAIDAVDNFDTIIVDPGTYYENINFKGKNITVRSTDPENSSVVDSTIIDGGGNGSVVVFESGETRDAVLAGFTITNGYSDHGAGVRIASISHFTSATIMNNVITNNKNAAGAGIYLSFSDALIISNIIESNTTRENASGGGIYVGLNADVEIINNIIRNNFAGMQGGGIKVDASPLIEGNTITDNIADWHSGAGGIAIHPDEGNPILRNNEISDNTPFDIDE